MLLDRIKNLARRTPLRRVLAWYRGNSLLTEAAQAADRIQEWRAQGCPVPPPPPYKWSVVRQYGRQFGISTLVETGTFLGDTLWNVRECFDEIYSIELSPELFTRALKRFRQFSHVHIMQGDSAVVLPRLLRSIHQPAVFWLDGHYSAGITAKGEKYSPIVEEICALLAHPIHHHVILIDDARAFRGCDDYPSLESLRDRVTSQGTYAFQVEHDIIRLLPQSGSCSS